LVEERVRGFTFLVFFCFYHSIKSLLQNSFL
jgi:hypothetical protein